MPKIEGFNYEGLEDAQVRKVAREAAKQIRAHLNKATTSIVEVGRRLHAVRAQLSAAEWKAWLEAEFQWSQSQASNYMRTSERFGELKCLDHFQPTALFVLCRNKATDAAVAEAVEQAESGEIVTHKRAQEILARHEIAPTRTDAGQSRKSPSPAPDTQSGDAVDLLQSAEDVFTSIDQFCARVDKFAATLDREKREELADRFLELAMHLRSKAKTANPKQAAKKPAKTKSRRQAAAV